MRQVIVGFGLDCALHWNLLGARSKYLVSQDVQSGCFVDRFHRVLLEQLIAPGNQIVDILHNHVFLIGNEAHASDEVWVEGILPPLFNLIINA